MPSEKILEQKKAVVAELTDRLQNSVAGVLVNYKGISVADDTKLRKELREAGVQYTVVKNTLLLRAAQNANLAGLEPVLENTTALATSAKALGGLNAPISGFVAVLNGNLRGLVCALNAIAQQKQEA